MITLNHVSKTYASGNIKALRDVSLHIEPGEFVSVVGQSGTGKSTLIKMLYAEERPDKGEVIIGDWDITDITAKDIPHLRRQIGVIFQDFRLLPKKTVFENVSFAMEVSGAPSEEIKKTVPQVLKIVGLHDKTHVFPDQTSGGEQQRVAIARALVHRPKLLLADEPTGNLDTITAQEIMELLLRINDFGTTVVLVTHNREIVNQIKRRVITMEGGKIVRDEKKGKYVI